MRKYLVMTITGHDQTGLVRRITGILLDHDANVEISKMSRLAGVFAMIMLVSVPEEKFDALRERVRLLREEKFKVTTSSTDRGFSSQYAGWSAYRVTINGADHEGIIYQIARGMANLGINVESLDTSMSKAPMSGTPLFRMSADVVVPPDMSVEDWESDLHDAGDDLGVDIKVSPIEN